MDRVSILWVGKVRFEDSGVCSLKCSGFALPNLCNGSPNGTWFLISCSREAVLGSRSRCCGCLLNVLSASSGAGGEAVAL